MNSILKIDSNSLETIKSIESIMPQFWNNQTTLTTNKSLLFLFSRPVETYTSPTQTQCFNVNYYIPEDEVSDKFSDDRWDRTREYQINTIATFDTQLAALLVTGSRRSEYSSDSRKPREIRNEY